jgi:hypothetical protein
MKPKKYDAPLETPARRDAPAGPTAGQYETEAPKPTGYAAPTETGWEQGGEHVHRPPIRLRAENYPRRQKPLRRRHRRPWRVQGV